MTKAGLIEQLQAIPGNPIIYTWDPDTDAWAPVTGFTYDEQEVRLYTDVDDAEEPDADAAERPTPAGGRGDG